MRREKNGKNNGNGKNNDVAGMNWVAIPH